MDKVPNANNQENVSESQVKGFGRGIEPRPEVLNTVDPPLQHVLRALLVALQRALPEEKAGVVQDGITWEHVSPLTDEKPVTPKVESYRQFEKYVSSLVTLLAAICHDRRLLRLDTELKDFAGEVRQLSSSARILSAISNVRSRLRQIEYILHENAANLLPGDVDHRTPDGPSWMQRSPSINPELHILTVEDAGTVFDQLKASVEELYDALEEFPEFVDDHVDMSILGFVGDLKRWTAYMDVYKGRMNELAVSHYLHDLSGEVGQHCDAVASTISELVRVGVPEVRLEQARAMQEPQVLLAVATLFSGVSATTIQITVDESSTFGNVVNGLWLYSLIFSVASVVNTLLGMLWNKTIYRSPEHRLAWWVMFWMKRMPLILLMLSVITFFVGLIMFPYLSHENLVVSLVGTALAGASSLGLFAILGLIGLERWTFYQFDGTKWPADLFRETQQSVKASMPYVTARENLMVLKQRSTRRMSYFGHWLRTLPQKARILVFRSRRDSHWDVSISPPALPMTASDTHDRSDAGGSQSQLPIEQAMHSNSNLREETTPPSDSNRQDHRRLEGAVRMVMSMQRSMDPLNPRESNWYSVPGAALPPFTGAGWNVDQDDKMHLSLVKDMQFSPDGNTLATASWDGTAAIFTQKNGSYTRHRTLAHHEDVRLSQVVWSPDGNHLLTRLDQIIKLWTKDGLCVKTLRRSCYVRALAWLADGQAFLLVEENASSSSDTDVVKISVSGKLLEAIWWPSLEVHDIAITPDGDRVIAIATYRGRWDGMASKKSRLERRLFGQEYVPISFPCRSV
ncbi:hypothetical protein PUNSTDRAFT_143932 [Punctularia strigosozonata HHB-11173 SS5]|uniref:uncharacterized protein n=1 Tax=Punctularia strigosozonata (strain HHB-11173) TaxID=741275 RepID=UPI0004417580|nr:uncharacterized protein PUNSTDRAFT_143932 [Punctularia strigosozonata HHB-11173 SS5]EIN08297.1 hypothetical protein PUNSTDRAFT_143932 [Punctularia strigosozonata HHB-11173 SS5]